MSGTDDDAKKSLEKGLYASMKQLINTSQVNNGIINEICFNKIGDYFAICYKDGTSQLFAHSSSGNHTLLTTFNNSVSSISFGESSLFCMSWNNGHIKIMNASKYDTEQITFNCNQGPIGNVKFIPIKPSSVSNHDQYLGVMLCSGYFIIYRISMKSIFDEKEKRLNQKIIKIHEFKTISKKIDESQTNHKLTFDHSKTGELIAFSGDNNVKIIDTKNMQIMNEINNNMMLHNTSINCVQFNNDIPYILASSDINGGVKIWKIKYDDTDNLVFEANQIDLFQHEGPICNLFWENENELILLSLNGNISKHYVNYNNKNGTEERDKVSTTTINDEEDESDEARVKQKLSKIKQKLSKIKLADATKSNHKSLCIKKREIMYYLKRNEYLMDNVLNGLIDPSTLITMPSDQMVSNHRFFERISPKLIEKVKENVPNNVSSRGQTHLYCNAILKKHFMYDDKENVDDIVNGMGNDIWLLAIDSWCHKLISGNMAGVDLHDIHTDFKSFHF